MKRMFQKRSSQKGQAMVEYVMLLLVVAGIASLLFARMPDLLAKIEVVLQKDFVANYRFGDPKAKGPEEGDPERHPRIFKDGNFRVFGRGS